MKKYWKAILVGLAFTGAAAGLGYWYGQKHAGPAMGTAFSDGALPANAAPAPAGERKPLYYRNPMGLPDTSPVPKKDWMGMDYIPVYEGEEELAEEGVKINLAKVQRLGVRTEPAAKRKLVRSIQAAATIQFDERRQFDVTTKFEGWIEKLLVNATGEPVRQGQLLMMIYSPQMLQAQEEYLVAQRLKDGGMEGADRLLNGALMRLRNLDLPKAVVDRLIRDRIATRQIPLASPATGIVLEKSAVEGMRVMPGEKLYRVVDDRQMWVVADIFEQDLSLVQSGLEVAVKVNAYPGKAFAGKVAYIYPNLNRETRTARVRIEVPNPEGMLKADMYATVELSAPVSSSEVTVPEGAVLDTGNRQVVLVDMGEGRFEPRQVKLGARGDGYVAVLDGVFEREAVVVSANFLIDAESNLKAALNAFTAEPKATEMSK